MPWFTELRKQEFGEGTACEEPCEEGRGQLMGPCPHGELETLPSQSSLFRCHIRSPTSQTHLEAEVGGPTDRVHTGWPPRTEDRG